MGTKRFFAGLVALAGCVDMAQAQTPKPGALETYRDWTIGCDNSGHCEAFSLFPADGVVGDDPTANIGVLRDSGPQAEPEIWAAFEGKGRQEVSFTIDGQKVTSATAKDGEVTLKGQQAGALAVAVARGSRLEMRVGGKLVGSPSLSGSGAALRYMDAQQGRAGTVSALIATGPLARTAVRRSPILPIIRRVKVASGGVQNFWREELAAIGKLTGCTDEMKDAEPPTQHRLSATETLVLVPCGSGAYNFTSVPLIATGAAGRRTFRRASFDYQPGWSEDAKNPMLVNAGWEASLSRLDSFAKGRGLGDCGSSEAYVWDGGRFRLIEATSMGECRGAWRWIRTWTAGVVE
jgi:hypothetical protein